MSFADWALADADPDAAVTETGWPHAEEPPTLMKIIPWD